MIFLNISASVQIMILCMHVLRADLGKLNNQLECSSLGNKTSFIPRILHLIVVNNCGWLGFLRFFFCPIDHIHWCVPHIWKVMLWKFMGIDSVICRRHIIFYSKHSDIQGLQSFYPLQQCSLSLRYGGVLYVEHWNGRTNSILRNNSILDGI